MNIRYNKRQNKKLFRSITENLAVTEPQLYSPLYTTLFQLNETNYNHTELHHAHYVNRVFPKLHNKDTDTDNITVSNSFNCEIVNTANDTSMKTVFFKYAPMLCPINYMLGKYKKYNHLFTLPKHPSAGEQTLHHRMTSPINASFVDGFFSFLSSQLLDNHQFVNGIKFYGSYLGIKHNFKFDISDDLEELTESTFFVENIDKLFKIDEIATAFIKEYANQQQQSTLSFNVSDEIDISSLAVDISQSFNQSSSDNTIGINRLLNCVPLDGSVHIDNNDTIHSTTKTYSTSTNSSSSTNTSVTESDDNSDSESDCDDEYDGECDGDEEDGSDDSYSSTCCDSFVYIKQFPVNIIALEQCESVFDDLLVDDDITEDEIIAAFMQIIMTLITYQKAFLFTHNDLHSNNIMWVKTHVPFLYYIVNGKYYKVPTYGRIYKIIDFGRAIYTVNGYVYCSDSYARNQDADGMYNTYPFVNPNKPIVNPNYSFDLARLGCSIYDIFHKSDDKRVEKIVSDWCNDDTGKSILYKENGNIRYDGFKLCKMIARKVHRHIPLAQLSRPEFAKYETTDKKTITKIKLKKVTHIINIDGIQGQ